MTTAVTSAAPAASAAVAGRSGQTRRHHPARTPTAGNTGAGAAPTVPTLVGRLLPVPLPVPDWSKPIILILMLLTFLFALRAYRNGRQSRRLESEHEQLTTDLADLQAALVSDIPLRVGALTTSVAYSPAEGLAAGGDFYDAFTVDGGRVAIIVGDVSGHGRTALGRAAHMRYTLRAYVEMGLEPRAALKLAGRVLGAEEDDLFTTVAVAVYDPAAATLTYATAGHPAPVLLGAAAHEPISVCASPALGWGAPTGRRQTTVEFGDGDRACFFTDGVTEARVGSGLLGRAGLLAALAEGDSHKPAAELLHHVRGRARAVNDDMAACIVTPAGGAAVSGARVEELEVDLRQLDAGQGRRFLTACGVLGEHAEAALAQARQTAADAGAAVLRVKLPGAAELAAGGAAPSGDELHAAGSPDALSAQEVAGVGR